MNRTIADSTHESEAVCSGRRAGADRAGGVTARAVVLAVLVLLALAPVSFYLEVVWAKTSLVAGVPAVAPTALAFALLLAATIPVLRRWSLTRREVLVVYCILLVAAPVLSKGIVVWMLCKTVAYYYFGYGNSHWQSTFLQAVPSWFAPTERQVVEAFFAGHSTFPWDAWSVPLLAWSAFMVCLFLCSLCIIALFSRQWISNERLNFPLAHIPLEMIRQRALCRTGERASLPVSRAFWIGLGASLAVSLINSLALRFPGIPSIPLGPLPVVRWQRVGMWAGLGEINVVLWPWMIAIAYLLPRELSFSVWFFWIVEVALTVAAIAAGADPQRPEEWFGTSFPAPRYQGGGGMIALGVLAAWTARRHLLVALRYAFGKRSGGAADMNEPLPYRLAVFGAAITFVGMVYFGWAAGCRIFFAILLMGLIVGYYVVWARLRAETGLGFLPFPLEINDAMLIFPTSAFRVREYITVISTRWAFFPGFGESFEVCTGSALESLKVADVSRINARRLTRAMVVCFLIALGVAELVNLTGLYRHGMNVLQSARSWLMYQAATDGHRIAEPLGAPQSWDLNGAAAVLAGAAVAATLSVLRLRFWWWPLHPVGYVAAMCWGLHLYYMPFMVGWLAKTLVIRYGGLRVYQTSVPFAIGLVVGDLLNQAVWAAVTIVTKGSL